MLSLVSILGITDIQKVVILQLVGRKGILSRPCPTMLAFF